MNISIGYRRTWRRGRTRGRREISIGTVVRRAVKMMSMMVVRLWQVSRRSLTPILHLFHFLFFHLFFSGSRLPFFLQRTVLLFHFSQLLSKYNLQLHEFGSIVKGQTRDWRGASSVVFFHFIGGIYVYFLGEMNRFSIFRSHTLQRGWWFLRRKHGARGVCVG